MTLSLDQTSNLPLLRKLGLYIVEDFLSPDECDLVIAELHQNKLDQAKVFSEEFGSGQLLEEARKGSEGSVSPDLNASIIGKFEKELPAFKEHFGMQELFVKDDPRYFLYEVGDFFTLHHDRRFGREINITIFLNDECDEPSSAGYCGGQLSIYGLLSAASKTAGLTVRGQKGLLVAYRSGLEHEVSPITHGNRYAIVQFYYDR